MINTIKMYSRIIFIIGGYFAWEQIELRIDF